MLMLLAAPAARAQERRASVGAEVGYSRSDLGGPDAQQLRSRQGALTGVYLDLPIRGGFGVRPELLFALKGGRAETAGEGGTTLLDIELAYVEMPLLVRLQWPRGRYRPVIFGGPAPAVQIGCDLRVVLPGQEVRATCADPTVTLFRDLDFGLVAGGGVEARFSQAALALEARYTTGLRSALTTADVRNRALGVLLALTF
jgi:hypothetical protein